MYANSTFILVRVLSLRRRDLSVAFKLQVYCTTKVLQSVRAHPSSSYQRSALSSVIKVIIAIARASRSTVANTCTDHTITSTPAPAAAPAPSNNVSPTSLPSPAVEAHPTKVVLIRPYPEDATKPSSTGEHPQRVPESQNLEPERPGTFREPDNTISTTPPPVVDHTPIVCTVPLRAPGAAGNSVYSTASEFKVPLVDDPALVSIWYNLGGSLGFESNPSESYEFHWRDPARYSPRIFLSKENPTNGDTMLYMVDVSVQSGSPNNPTTTTTSTTDSSRRCDSQQTKRQLVYRCVFVKRLCSSLYQGLELDYNAEIPILNIASSLTATSSEIQLSIEWKKADASILANPVDFNGLNAKYKDWFSRVEDIRFLREKTILNNLIVPRILKQFEVSGGREHLYEAQQLKVVSGLWLGKSTERLDLEANIVEPSSF